MAIITLTSDLGKSSHYPAVVKGLILTRFPQATLIDVTHSVPSFDLMQAAYMVHNTQAAFPPGTVHVVAIDPDQDDSEGVVMHYRDQYFVGPNNGVMSLICDGRVKEGISVAHTDLIDERYSRSFRAGRVFAPVAAFLGSGAPFSEVGHRAPLKDLRWGEPSYNGTCLRGKIIYIDKFGNAITNIRRDNFLQLKQERRFEIFVRNMRLRRIVNTYADVPKADALAIFSQGGHLEIAMREASAAQLLGLKIHDMITIEFNA
jgi:S-adenosyl-L-methionine hydrolase (adenosine-forming)